MSWLHVVIDVPTGLHSRTAQFWTRVTGWPLGPPWQGPVRAHLDLGTDDVTAEVLRLRAHGADEIGPGRGWHTLRDSAGLPFCVTGNSPAVTARRDLS